MRGNELAVPLQLHAVLPPALIESRKGRGPALGGGKISGCGTGCQWPSNPANGLVPLPANGRATLPMA